MNYSMYFKNQTNPNQKNYPYYKVEIEIHKRNTIIKIESNHYYKMFQFRTLNNYYEIDINKEKTKVDMKNECLRINMGTNDDSSRLNFKATDFKIENGDGSERIVFGNEIEYDFELKYKQNNIDCKGFIENFYNDFININFEN